MRLTFVAIAALIALCGCNQQTELAETYPEIELSETTLDFESVERGFWRERSMAVYNQGNGTLHIEDYAFQTGSSEAFYFEDPDKEILPDTFAELVVRYTPTHEGNDAGAIVITSDDQDEPEVIIFLNGAGVIPHCEVEPTLLYFPTDLGDQALSFQVRSTGSGPLTIHSATLEEGTPEFGIEFPAGYEPPTIIDPGLTVDITVTFSPADELGRTDRVMVLTSDPDLEDGAAYVELVAAGEPPDGENQPPLVEITSPSSGAMVLADESVGFTGQVADLEEPPDALGILWHSSVDGYLTGGDPPDASGEVCLEVPSLTVGTHTITLSALDSEGLQGSDTIELTVYEEEEELEYTISGGATPYHYFHVDDDVTITVNGVPVFVDADGAQDHHAPTTFFAAPGDVLGVTATDQQWCTKALVPLYLHIAGLYSQELNEDINVSACVESDYFDATYNGPWPNVFLDETYVIAIP